MNLFCAAIFLLISTTKAEVEPENATDVMERTDEYLHTPTDFRCYKHALKDFSIRNDYPVIDYVTIPHPLVPGETIGCLNAAEVQKKNRFYPPLTSQDPMMEFYIGQLYAGMQYAPKDNALVFTSGFTALTRTKQYCHRSIRVASAFPEYWETFRSDDDTCLKMMELIRGCHIFRQIRESYNSKLYEKLCLDEDGCYNVMEYYAEDLPYCVKYTAIGHFKNASVGSWHHSILNYCHLREMVPEVKEAKYEQSILKGKTKGDLTKMCLYLRHRLLPEEGKETAMPDPDQLDYPDDTTTAQYGSSGISEISTFWTVAFVLADYNVWASN